MSDVSQNRWSGWDELKLLQEFSKQTWQIYMNWFTWTLGANLLAMSYIFTRSEDAKLLVALGVITVSILVLSIYGGYRVKIYFQASLAQARSLARAAGGDHEKVDLLFGGSLAGFLHWAIPATLLLLALTWVFLVLWFGFFSKADIYGAG